MPDMQLTEARFGIGRVASQTFGLIGRNFFPILIVFLAVYAGEAALTTAIGAGAALWLPAMKPVGISWLPFLVNTVFKAFLFGAMAEFVFADLNGRRPDLSTAVPAGLRTMWPIFFATLLMSAGIALGLVLLIVPGIMLSARWVVVAPVLAIEGPGLRKAFARSASLTEGRRWTLFGVMALFTLLTILVFCLPIIASAMFGSHLIVAGFDAGPPLLNIVPATIVAAISTIGSAVVYAELLRVKEGGLSRQLAAVFD